MENNNIFVVFEFKRHESPDIPTMFFFFFFFISGAKSKNNLRGYVVF